MKRSNACTALLCLVMTTTALGYGVPLVKDGRAVVRVVLPAQPSQTLANAGEEVATYLHKMSGAKVDVGSAGTSPSRIVVRVSPNALAREDAFRIVTKPNEVALIGGGEMGALYAAYAFLEDLGVRWLYAGEEGERVPKQHTITYPQTDRTETPSFKCRFFYVRNEDATRWAVRNRINGFFPKDFAEAHGNGYYLPPMVRSIHSFAHILPPEKYFETNRDFYALIRGKRVRPSIRRNQLCTSNPRVVEIIAKAIREYFQQTPSARVFSIAPNDGYGWCECERCKAIDEKMCGSKKWYHREGEPVVSDRLCVFANEVAKRAVYDMPGRELYMFSYVSYCEPPDTARPDPHVTHVVCHYIPACYAHPINTPGCPDNEIYNRFLKGWSRISPQMMVYAYTDKSQWLGLPRPVVRQMAADIQHYRSLGIRKYLAQSSAWNWPQMGPLYYVTAKLLWNADRDVEELIREWNRAMYRAAAKEMMAWYDALEAVVAKSGGHYRGDPYRQASNVYSPGCFADASAHLAKALTLAETDLVRERITKVKSQFEYGAAGTYAICLNEQWAESGDKDKLAQAKQAAAKLLGQKRRWGGISMRRFKERLDGIAATQADGVCWEGWADVEEKGGRECRNSDETGKGDNAAGWASFYVIVSDLTQPYRITMEVWGESQFGNLIVCSKGKGKGTSAGGVWKPLPKQGQVNGKPEWCTIVFTVPPEMLDKETKRQRFGFGGADSQVWVADIRFETDGK